MLALGADRLANRVRLNRLPIGSAFYIPRADRERPAQRNVDHEP